MSEKKITYCTNWEEASEEYTMYINNHIRNVQNVYYMAEDAFKVVFPEVYQKKSEVIKLLQNLNIHDRSKFDPLEFYYYAARFFPVEGTDPKSKKVKDNFNIAWLHHVHYNPHHPAYWTLVENGKIEYFNMPDIYIIEMLCDWMAMSKYYNSTTLEYWKSESAQKLPMRDYTKSKVNEFMEWMYKNNVHTLW